MSDNLKVLHVLPTLKKDGAEVQFANLIMEIKNTEIANHLALPPVKIHCSVLAEDAIKAAVADYKVKNKK